MSRVTIESAYLQQGLRWEGNAESEPTEVEVGRTYSFYVDKDFVGSLVKIESWVEYADLPIDDALNLKLGEGRWVTRKTFGNDLEVPITANTIEYVPPEAFSGISKIRLVSDANETCTGAILVNT